jgi:hypothetical protein
MASVYGRSLAGVAGSNPAQGVDVCSECFMVLRERLLLRYDVLSREVLPSSCVSFSMMKCNNHPIRVH